MKASLIIIGNEILSGRTQDKNLSYLANWLNEIGIQLTEVRVIRDEEDNPVCSKLSTPTFNPSLISSGR